MQLDFLILADRAEAVNGKLYLLGGAWDRLGLTSLPGQPTARLRLRECRNAC